MFIALDHRAGPLKKADLKYRYPEQGAVPDLKELAQPDASRLNRHQWYEVLYFVNMFANLYGKGSPGVAKHAEKLLHEHVPPELHSHDRIKQWLLDHWKFHS